MKGRLVVLGEYREREAAALVVDGRLEDLLVAPADDAPPAPGAILRGTLDRFVKGQGGVFVKLPEGRNGMAPVPPPAPRDPPEAPHGRRCAARFTPPRRTSDRAPDRRPRRG